MALNRAMLFLQPKTMYVGQRNTTRHQEEMNMKKSRHLVAALALSLGMMCSMNLSASAREYALIIPSPYAGSLQSTGLCQKTTNDTPYVKPRYVTISTNYFLSPFCENRTQATNIVTTNDTFKHSFTWHTGYGGIGGLYCLSAYPNVSGAYQKYNVEGTWSE